MKKIIIILAFSLTLQSLCSQSNFHKGYIIQQNKDTIYGLIDYKAGESNGNYCKFKTSQKHEEVLYTPFEISGFGFVNDKYFEPKKIQKKDKKPVFIELLIKGKVSLYKFEQYFYVEKSDSTLYKLSNERKLTEMNQRIVSVPSNKYIGILTFLMSDCQGLESEISKTTLGEKSLTGLVEMYNRKMNTPFLIYKVTKPWLHANFGVVGGLNLSRLAIFSNYLKSGRLKSSFVSSPSFGVSIDLSSPRLTERISFHGELNYSNSNYNLNDMKTYYGISVNNFIDIEISQLKIPLGIRYTFPGTKVTPYVDLDITGTFHLKTKSDWKQMEVNGSNTKIFQADPIPISRNQLGLMGGAGLMTHFSKKLSGFFEFKFERTNGLVKDQFFSQSWFNSKVTNFQLVIGLLTR